MSDLESLLLVLAAVYLFECAVWVRRGGVAIHGSGQGTWSLSHPGSVLGNAHGAVFLANPLPPLGLVLLSYPFPLSVSPTGTVSFMAVAFGPSSPAPQTVRYLTHEESRDINCQGRNLLINGQSFAQLPSPLLARFFAVWLRKLKALPPGERASAIRERLEATLDSEAVRQRWEEFQKAGKWLRILGNVLFFYLFLIGPALVWRFGFLGAGPGLALGLLLQTFTMGWLFWRAHGRLFPGGAEERFTPFLTMLLAPPTAIRACDLLGRRLVESWHPVAVAKFFCSAAAHKRLARQVLVDLHYPFPPAGPSDDPRVIAVVDWFREVLREETGKALERAGLDRADLMQPPARTEPANCTYCPRCGAQFVLAEGSCAECGGRRLHAFL